MITENVKNLAEQEKGRVVKGFLKSDIEFQMKIDKFTFAEDQYLSLSFSEEQREVILAYMRAWSEVTDEYSIYSYLAGVKYANVSECFKYLNI